MYRFAPSPTKDIHINNLRVALLNYICAKQKNERFIVRIEDTDKSKNIEGKEKDILSTLHTFGIKYDEVYYQSNNFKYHLQFASTLLDEKKAFMCFCTKKELKTKKEEAKKENRPYKYDGTCENLNSDYILNSRKPFVIRIKKPSQNISFHDTIKGDFTFESDSVDSFTIMNEDKYPTYNFACAIDDMLQGITEIIREDNHLPDTPKQEHIRKSLGYDAKIKYTHLPIVLNNKGEKADSADKENNVHWLLDQGYMPEAIVNYLILLGNQTPKEIFMLDDALKWFDLKNISESAEKFDIDKLGFINKEHIKLLNAEELAKRIGYSGKVIGKLAKLYTEEASTTFEIKQKIDAIFAPKNTDKEFSENHQTLLNIVKNAPYFKEFDDFKKYLTKKSGLKGEFLLKPLRILLTNSQKGPELAHLYPLIKNYIKEVVK